MNFQDFLADAFGSGQGLSISFKDIDRLQQRMNSVFDDFFKGTSKIEFSDQGRFMPSFELQENDSQYVISFDLPGVKKDDIKVDVYDHQLVVKGEKREKHKQKQNGWSGHKRFHGTFTRTFTLPDHVDPKKIEAVFEDGVLEITMPRQKLSNGKQILISDGKKLDTKVQNKLAS